MQEAIIVQGTSICPLYFTLVSNEDHRTPVLGANPAVVISQNTGVFAVPAGAIFEAGEGDYGVEPNALDVAISGPLCLNATAPGADPASRIYQVVPAYGVPPLSVGQANVPLVLLLVSATDHITGLPGLSPTVLTKPVGNAYATPAGAIMEIGGAGNGIGYYYVAGDALDTAIGGPLRLFATADGADDVNTEFFISMPPPLPEGVYNDFMAAVVAQLRSWNAGAVPTALAENTAIPGGTKIWADNAAYGQPDAPHLVYSEPACPFLPESKDPSGAINYYGHGTLTFTLTDVAKAHCRNTARLVVSALNDADEEPTFVFENGYCLELRLSNPDFPIVSTNELNSPVTYQAVLEFEYVISFTF